MPEPTKINVPVLDAQHNVVPDVIPMNGVRVRCTRLTGHLPVQYESKKFNGKVCWRGVTDAFDYEMNGDGPFLHRRIIFQAEAGLSFADVELLKLVVPCSKWCRSSARPLSDGNMALELRRMFGSSATVRDLLFSPVSGFGYNVVCDTRKQLEGKASGVRRSQKYWKGFGKTGRGTVVKYEMSAGGVPSGDLAEGEHNLHIYAMDIFQYGINGLDNRVPAPTGAGQKRGSEDEGGGSLKRKKSDKSDSSYDEMNVDGLNIGEDGLPEERFVQGVVRVLSNMKLYWYDPK